MSIHPSKEALDRALAILLAEVNGRTDQTTCVHAMSTNRDTQSDPLDSVHSSTDDIASIDATSDILRALRTHIDGRLTQLLRRHNSLMPINDLPEELLVAILQQTSEDRDLFLDHLRNLASVQSSWWHLIKHTPAFWTDLNMNASKEVTALKLRLSQNAPLNIPICSLEWTLRGPDRWMAQVEPHRDRIQSFTFSGPNIEGIAPYLERPYPSLEHLLLEATKAYDDLDEPDGMEADVDFDTDFFDAFDPGPVPMPEAIRPFVNLSVTPNLKVIHIKSILLPFAQLSNLSSLTIDDIPESALLPHVLPQIITSSPHLLELDLENTFRDGERHVSGVEPTPGPTL